MKNPLKIRKIRIAYLITAILVVTFFVAKKTAMTYNMNLTSWVGVVGFSLLFLLVGLLFEWIYYKND